VNLAQQRLQRGLRALDPWLDAIFPVTTALICAKARLAGYSLLVVYLLLRLLQRSDREPWRWILISLLVVNAGLIIEDRDFKPGGPSDYLILALSFTAGLQRNRASWRESLYWIVACIIPLLAFSLAAGEKMIRLTQSFTGFNINLLGFLAGLLTIHAYSLWMLSKDKCKRVLILALLFACITESGLTQSRAAIAAPIAAIALDQASRIKWNKKRAALFASGIAAGCILMAHNWYKDIPGSNNGIADLNRITTIRCWVDSSIETPINFALGQGYGKNVRKKCSPSKDPGLIQRDKPLAHAHNFFVQILGETGIFGFTLVCGLTTQALRKAWSKQPTRHSIPDRPLMIYLLLMAMGSTWHSMLLNQVLVGYSLAALTATDRDPSAADAAIPTAPQGASAPPV